MNINKSVNRRSLLIGVLITLLFFLLILKTFYIQTVEAPMLKEKANNIWNSSTILDPKRGTIFDRNGERLAYNKPAYTVVAILSKKYSNHIIDPKEVANKLSPILKMDKEDLYTLLTKDAYQVEIRPGGWKIDKDVADKIRELNIPGIILKDETKRYYPNNALASYVLGFVNYDNQAVMGVEREYDELLSGESGSLKVMKDLKGYELPESEEVFQPAKDGKNVVLTIDKTIQQYVESALDKAETMYHPKKMVAIVADPNTGEILGMSDRPTYNPNQYWNIKDYRNAAISYQFEPGSTFKIVTLAAAIEENLFDSNATYESGTIDVYGTPVHDYNNGKGWGKITYLEGVQRSSNVAFVILGYKKLGKERLFSYINNFGFGEKTGIDLPSEVNGRMIAEKDAYPFDVAAMSFGQGIGVTPIQQVMAVSAIANGGNLMKPYIVKEVSDYKSGEIEYQNEPTIRRRVVSPETAKKTRDVLEKVVEFEKQKNGYIDGYHVAGKTGTAQVFGENGTYSKNKSVASFIGFAPADHPKLLVYVVVDEPDLNIPYFGSTIAVPIFRDIMQNSLMYLKVPYDSENKSSEIENKEVIVDNYKEQSINNAKTHVSNMGFTPIVLGSGNSVVEQYPEPGLKAMEGSRVFLMTASKDKLRTPDLKGKTLREALEYCFVLDIKVKTTGDGIVIYQNIQPGESFHGKNMELKLEDPKKIYQK